ncbi:MAG TPA: hypothetical protein VMZ26_12820 [Pyrinomonadaceae bacterium]|nr:hypothetical protein [Pyrinomonadaceae bacterium]
MSEIDDLEKELNESLAGLGASSEKPCGCHDAKGAAADNPFAEFSASEDAAAELELALGALGGEDFSAEDALEFAMASSAPSVGLEEIVALTQQYPGLKITFSN